MLDEMNINDVKRYAILEPNDPIDSLIAIKNRSKTENNFKPIRLTSNRNMEENYYCESLLDEKYDR